MKKLGLLVMITWLAFSCQSTRQQQGSYSGNNTRNKVTNTSDYQYLTRMVDQQSYSVVVDRIASSSYIQLTGLRLSGLYGLWISKEQFKVYLPIYGINSFDPTSIARRIDFFTNKYDYKIQKTKNDGWYVTIKATDPFDNNDYTFNVSINANGAASVTVSTTYRSPITFDGTIRPL